jgi:hypothetical protein
MLKCGVEEPDAPAAGTRDLSGLTDEELHEELAVAHARTAKAEEEAARAQERSVEAHEKLVRAVENYVDLSWKAADALLVNGDSLALFAIQRAYYAIYNVSLICAQMLGIPLARYQQGSQHHVNNDSVPHSQLSILVSDILKIVFFAQVADGDTGKCEQAFEMTRILQKYRKRADYMGCEKVSLVGARECVKWARTLVETIWGYAKENHDDELR